MKRWTVRRICLPTKTVKYVQLLLNNLSDGNIVLDLAVTVTLVVLRDSFPHLLQSLVPYTAVASIPLELSPCINLRSST